METYNKIAILFNCFINNGLQSVQSNQNPIYLHVVITNEQSGIVEILGIGEWCNFLKQSNYIFYFHELWFYGKYMILSKIVAAIQLLTNTIFTEISTFVK